VPKLWGMKPKEMKKIPNLDGTPSINPDIEP
jgi:hypothetical protein